MNSARRSPDDAPAGHEQDGPEDYAPSDEELGVGVAEDIAALAASAEGTAEVPAGDDVSARIAAALADPAIAATIQLMVAQGVAQLTAQNAVAPGASPAPPAVDIMAAMREFAQTLGATINRSAAATIEQMPGHIKPVAVEVIEERAAAYVEMQALLRETGERYIRLYEEGDRIEADKCRPIYLLLEDFPADNTTYEQGDTMVWWGPPGLHMRPQTAIAVKIWNAMATYSGEAPSAAEIAAEAIQLRRPSMPGANAVPELPPLLSAREPRQSLLRSGLLDGERQDLSPPNIVGTVVKVMKGGIGLKQRTLSEDMASY